MSIDFSSYRVPVFSGINDNPIAPTSSKAGNGSHLISLYNNLIAQLETSFKELKDESSGRSTEWTVIDCDYNYPDSGSFVPSRLDSSIYILNSTARAILIDVPYSSLIQGNYLTFANTNESITININLNNRKYKGQEVERLSFLPAFSEGTIIYTGDNLGWMPVQDAFFEAIHFSE